MDFALKRFALRARTPLFPRGADLSTSYRELLQSSQARLKFQVVALLALSLTLGGIAYRYSLDRARADWLREHPPSLKTWLVIARAAGFSEMAPSAAKDQVMQAAPFIPRPEDELYLDAEVGILLLSRPEGLFFFTRGRPVPIDTKRTWSWEALGKGWESAESLTGRTFIDPAADRAKTTATRAPADPKLLSY